MEVCVGIGPGTRAQQLIPTGAAQKSDMLHYVSYTLLILLLIHTPCMWIRPLVCSSCEGNMLKEVADWLSSQHFEMGLKEKQLWYDRSILLFSLS